VRNAGLEEFLRVENREIVLWINTLNRSITRIGMVHRFELNACALAVCSYTGEYMIRGNQGAIINLEAGAD